MVGKKVLDPNKGIEEQNDPSPVKYTSGSVIAILAYF
jgi:hypothetical protein